MEGGAIMNNTAGQSGGGVYIFSNGSFKKTGGVIYGANAPAGYRNTALVGLDTVKSYGHSVAVANVIQLFTLYRDDTVKENDNLMLLRVHGNVLIGKWDTPGKALLRMLIAIILPVLVFVAGVFLILWRRYYKRLAGIVQAAADTTPYIDLENMGLTDREKDLCELLLTDRPLKEIADILGLTYAGGHKKVRKLYVKLGIDDRMELLVRIKSGK
jgi:DNA-binding CsgD family transcriptional regulator